MSIYTSSTLNPLLPTFGPHFLPKHWKEMKYMALPKANTPSCPCTSGLATASDQESPVMTSG